LQVVVEEELLQVPMAVVVAVVLADYCIMEQKHQKLLMVVNCRFYQESHILLQLGVVVQVHLELVLVLMALIPQYLELQ
jgi:hypothetical protein